MNWQERSNQTEILDGTDNAWEEIFRNLKELNVINHWLGGHSITIQGFRSVLGNKKKVRVCEIGCGGGDNLMVLSKWAANNGIKVECIGIDINKDCINYASQQFPACEYLHNDYRNVQFSQQPDIIFSSLFCHHFTEDVLVEQLLWMKKNSRLGFFINDLHRNRIAFYSIKWLTLLFSRSRLVKNDAPISVQRGFIEGDWYSLIRKAGIKGAKIKWKWAFRWLVTASNPEND